jgi:hypothetical protein
MLQVQSWKVDVTVGGNLVKTFHESATTSKSAVAKAKYKMRGAVSSVGAFKYKATKTFGSSPVHHTAKKSPKFQEQRAEIGDALAAYGAHLTEDDHIAMGSKVMSVRAIVKGGRLRIESGDNLLASYPSSRIAKGISDFVESFWFWKKNASPGPSHITKKSPAQIQREIDDALTNDDVEA